MKKMRLYCASLLCFLPMLTANVATDGIKQITKPYLGTYRAESLRLGNINVLPLLKDAKVELTADGRLLISYKQAFQTKIHEFAYKTDEEGRMFIGDSKTSENWQEIRYEEGKLYATVPFGGKTLRAVLSR